MKNFIRILIITCGGFSAQALAQSSPRVLEHRFEMARVTAVMKVSETLDCEIQTSSLAPEIKNWLLNPVALFSLSQDLLVSPHKWNTGLFQSCVTTQNFFAAPLYFS